MAAHNEPTELIKDKADGQHWTTVRELWMRKDKEQCESWKDEVQNVLIFSGLFSAIVTAFLIESHKALRQDPAQESLQLLRQIAAQSAGQSWVAGSLVEPSIAHAISLCVNIFWFLSLVLSLTAALIGIVSLQWIRTHMRTLGDGSESLGLSHMHSLGLQKSYIPLIFTSLPVILILGLIFFLVGLIVFLFELSWAVATPVAIAIGLTFVFLLTTTLHPALQSVPGTRLSDNPDCFPSPYRSAQSLLFLRMRDWASRSRSWLQQRQKDFAVKGRPLSHLEPRIEVGFEGAFPYDIIKALVAVKESRSAESENERTALAKCLAEVLPIHMGLFSTEDLADLIPFLPPSEFVPSALFSRENSATEQQLCAVALVQIATCKGRPSQTAALVKACVLTTCWLFEQPRTLEPVPNNQPLDLISKPDELSGLPDVLEVLIDTLTRFFAFAADFRPESQSINKTTHTSSYTYWFLVLTAKILTTEGLLSGELQKRHEYLLVMIADRLSKSGVCDYLCLMALIYASAISSSSTMCSSPSGRNFLRAVTDHRDRLSDLGRDQSQLYKAVKANEVVWGHIESALRASDTAFVANSAGANDTAAERPTTLSQTYDRGPAPDEGGESGGRSMDHDYAATQSGGVSTPVRGGGLSQYISLEEVDSSGFGSNLGEGHQGRSDIVIDIDSPSS